MPWNTLGTIAPNTLRHAREQLHQAVQLVGLAGRNFLPSDDGDAYANQEWINKHRALAGHWVGERDKYRTAMQFPTLSLLLLNRHDAVLASLPLHGKKYQKAFSWLQHVFAELGFDASKLSLRVPYEIPDPMAQHASFSTKEEKALEELACYFANADGVLQLIKQQTQNKASDVRCWPHHFGIATLITLEAHEDAGPTKNIGIGFSPGDESISEPYFYVNCQPFPNPEKNELPELPDGHWHTEGRKGTVLLATEIIHADHQQLVVEQYVKASTHHLQTLMGYSSPLVSLTF